MTKRVLLVGFFAVLIVGIKAQSFNMVIQTMDGNEETWTSETLKNIYFEGDTMLIIVESGSMTTHSYLLADIQKLYFPTVLSVRDFQQESAIFVYPNPSQDQIRIIGATYNQPFQIYAIDGRKVGEGCISDEFIDITHLAKGFYLVKIGTQTLKFSKL